MYECFDVQYLNIIEYRRIEFHLVSFDVGNDL